MCNVKYGSNSVVVGLDENKSTILSDVDVVFNTGAAGIQLMDDSLVKASSQIKICADVNAVPPSGIAGVEANDDVVKMENASNDCYGIGALAIGNIKYKSQHDCLKLMYTSDKPVFLHFEHAFEFAQKDV